MTQKQNKKHCSNTTYKHQAPCKWSLPQPWTEHHMTSTTAGRTSEKQPQQHITVSWEVGNNTLSHTAKLSMSKIL